MPRRAEAGPAVPVTVTAPGAPPPAPVLAPRPPSRRPVVVLLVVPVLLLAGLAVRDARRSAAGTEARAAAGLRLSVVGATESPAPPGVPGEEHQSGLARVVVSNDGPTPLRLVSAAVDGGAARPAPGRLAAGGTVTVTAGWRVLCAEIGNQPGPRTLDLRVRLRSSRSYLVVLPLPGTVTDRAFHSAASSACDVLVHP